MHVAVMLGLNALSSRQQNIEQAKMNRIARRSEIAANIAQDSQHLGDAISNSDFLFKVKEK